MNDWAPERIWLQRGMGDEGSHTWCENPIGEVRTDGDDIEEVEYVRAISPFEDDGVAPEDRNCDVLDVINKLDKIMRDQAFPIEQRIHDLEHVAAFALRFRDHLSKVR